MSKGHNLRCAILLLLLVIKTNFAQTSPILAPHNGTITNGILKLLEEVREERDYNTIAICRSPKDDCIFDQMLHKISMPVVLINKRQKYVYKAQLSKELLILLCLHQTSIAAALAELSVFRGLKQTRIVAYAPHAPTVEIIQEYCIEAMANDFYNVLIIQKDFSETNNYYTCNKFPPDSARYKKKSLQFIDTTSKGIFPHQFLNMHGTKILIYPDQLVPQSILYYKSDGKLELEGYVGRMLRVFAARRNATLAIEHPYEVGKTTFYGELRGLVANGTIDVGAGLTFPHNDLEGLYCAVQPLDYCYMVPLPESVPINELFAGIIRLPTLFCIFAFIIAFAALLTHLNNRKKINFIDLVLNDQSIRGILGQSFVVAAQPSFKLKFVVFMLCYMSIITNTTYQAYLQSFLTHPPLQPMRRSYEDMEAAGLTILFPAQEMATFGTNRSLSKHMRIVKTISDYNTWLKHRSSMNTRYVYPVSSVRWAVFEAQQSLFNRPIFYFNQDLCFYKSTFHCMPVRPDLPYRDLLEEFILRLHASGILKIWVSLNFFVLAKLKLVAFEDLSKPLEFGRPLVVDDFFWTRIQYFGSMALGFVAFVGEVLYFRWKKQKSLEQEQHFEYIA